MIVTHKIKMDLSRRGITPVVHMVQGDSNTRALEISLYDNGQPWEVPAGASVVANYEKKGGTSGLYDLMPDGSNAWSITAPNILMVYVAPKVLTVKGHVDFTASLALGDDVINTFLVDIHVEPRAGFEGGTEEPEPDVYQQIIDMYTRYKQAVPLFANSVKECTDMSKVYVLPDGYIYAYMRGSSAYPVIEIEKQEGGYWNREEGWVEEAGYHGERTNFIPVSVGDKFSYSGLGCWNAPSVIYYDTNKTRLSYEQHGEWGNGASNLEITIPEGVAYARFYSFGISTASWALAVSWVLCQAASERAWANTGHAFVPADYEDRILDLETANANQAKTLAEHGQSIAALEETVEALEGADLPARTAALEQSVRDLSGSAVQVDASVAFDWDNIGSYAQGAVGGAVTFTEEGGNYGYTALDVLPGEVYTVSAKHAWNAFAYAVTDENSVILQMDDAPGGVATDVEAELTIPAGAKYLYLNKYGFKSLTKKTLVSTALADPLMGKKIVYDGDSICYGAGYVGGYAKLIAARTFGKYVNQAVGGGILRSASALGKSGHSVVDNLANLPKDGDLYCFEGGINDWWGTATLGTYTLNDFTGALDTTTICGAMETIFRYALDNFTGKPICFVITHKIQGSAYGTNGAGDTFKDYRDAMVGICEKYSIPYYDAFSESGLNGWHSGQDSAFLTGNANNTPDGCHPNEAGYKRYYVPQLLALFRRILPVE